MLVTLGMCVFLWGLGYKLSLYEVHDPGVHPIPEAKLLSRNEDPTATDRLRDCLSCLSKPAGSMLLISIVVFWSGGETPSRSVVIRDLALNERLPSLRNECLTRFFFRPPPALIRL
jgi:hypothetical protein